MRMLRSKTEHILIVNMKKPSFKQKQKVMAPMVDDSVDYTLMQNQLKSKEAELARLRKEIEETKALVSNKDKERDTILIKQHLEKIAKKLNVRDSVLEDVLDKVAAKFVIKDSKAIPVENPDMDPEKFLSDWLQPKADAFIAPAVATSTGATPHATGPLPVKQEDFDPHNEDSLAGWYKSKFSFLKNQRS